MEKAKVFVPLILVLVLSFFTIKPLLSPGYFPMHDDTQPSRIFEIAKALKDGQFPVRWVEDLGYGYGYPIFNFYAPLPYYFGALFISGGIGAITASKIMFAAGILLAAVTMYLLAEKLWGKWGGVISALLYIYAPYHAVQVYVRGSVGEYWAYALLPLVGFGVYLTNLSDIINPKKGILIGGLGLAGVILSHNITGMLTLGFLGLWFTGILLFKKNKNNLVSLISLIGIGLGLSAFFWLPAVTEAAFTKVATLTSGTNDFHNHFVFLDQLWNSPWGYGGSAPGRLDGVSFMLGKIQIILGLAGLGFLLYKTVKPEKKENYQKLLIFLVSGFVLSSFMLLPQSVFLWDILPVMKYVQYPWRFLVFAGFFLALSAGAIGKIELFKDQLFKLGILGVSALILLAVNDKYFQPQFLYPATDADYTSENNLKWKISKISDEYLPRDFPVPQKETDIPGEKFTLSNDIIIEQSEVRSHFYNLVVSANHPAEIIVNTAYFPGWETVVDTVKQPVAVRNGLIMVQVPEGKHIVTVFCKDTWVKTLGNLISLLSGITILVLLLKLKHVYGSQ